VQCRVADYEAATDFGEKWNAWVVMRKVTETTHSELFAWCVRWSPRVGGVPKIRGLDKAVGKSGPAFWECFPHMGFTHCKAQGKHYHEMKELFQIFLWNDFCHLPLYNLPSKQKGTFHSGKNCPNFCSIYFCHLWCVTFHDCCLKSRKCSKCRSFSYIEDANFVEVFAR
jgi:hypothetical protein